MPTRWPLLSRRTCGKGVDTEAVDFSTAGIRAVRGKQTVAIVSPHYAPRVGGLESYVRRVALGVLETGNWRPIIITTNDARHTRIEYRDGIPVVRLGTTMRLSNTPIGPLWPLLVRRTLRKYDVSVVNAHSPVPFLADVAAWVAGSRPIVFTYHAGSMVKNEGRWDSIIQAYERFVLPRTFRRASVLVAVSRASLAYGHVNSETISPGVDIDRFVPPTTVRESKPVILFVGRLDITSAWKGVDVLLKAFSTLRASGCVAGVRLRVVGDGDGRSALIELAENLGIAPDVDFLGALEGDRLIEEYQSASVTVLPSLTNAESFGMTLIESMACGTPVVGSAIGGIPYVIEDDVTGLLVPPGDVCALAAACQRLLEDRELNARLGEAGRRHVVSSFSWKERIDRYIELFETLSQS